MARCRATNSVRVLPDGLTRGTQTKVACSRTTNSAPASTRTFLLSAAARPMGRVLVHPADHLDVANEHKFLRIFVATFQIRKRSRIFNDPKASRSFSRHINYSGGDKSNHDWNQCTRRMRLTCGRRESFGGSASPVVMDWC